MYEYRARCVNVVDGDTADLYIDLGFRLTTTQRIRLLGVDTPELRSKKKAEREAAQAATEFTKDWLCPMGLYMVTDYDLLIQTEKSDSFGRWLAWIYRSAPNEVDKDCKMWDMNLSEDLIKSGHGVKYEKK